MKSLKYIKLFNESQTDDESVMNRKFFSEFPKSKVKEIFADFLNFLTEEYPSEKFEIIEERGFIEKTHDGKKIKFHFSPGWVIKVPLNKEKEGVPSFKYKKELLDAIKQLSERAKSHGLICEYDLPKYYRPHLDKGEAAGSRQFEFKVKLTR